MLQFLEPDDSLGSDVDLRSAPSCPSMSVLPVVSRDPSPFNKPNEHTLRKILPQNQFRQENPHFLFRDWMRRN